MVRITFIEHDGTRHEVEAPVGQSLMQAARDNNVPGILAECGGVCACATCHVYLSEPAFSLAGERTDVERDMLEFAEGTRATSRLSCQVELTEAMDGSEVWLPASQR